MLQGDNQIEPTTANYTFKHILEVQNDMYEIDLCPSQLRGVSQSKLLKDPARILLPPNLHTTNDSKFFSSHVPCFCDIASRVTKQFWYKDVVKCPFHQCGVCEV